MNTVLAIHETRLPRPQNFEAGFWQILCEVIFPICNNARSIVLAVEYCRQRKLDILKRPVNIVPMWNSTLRKEVDTIWPSINETQITAARTGEWAGMDAPVFGETVKETFHGRRKDRDGSFVDAKETVTFPEWCRVTTYRLKQGQRCAFTGEPVYWREAYGRSAGSALPNGTWIKRPFGQLIKVAKAASLRAAFPEEDSSPTDEEMRGGIIDADDAEAETPQRPKIADAAQQPAGQSEPAAIAKEDGETWQQWGARLIAGIRAASDTSVVDQWTELNQASLDALEKELPKVHGNLVHSINKHRLSLPDAAQ